jgi:hypothetical protein
VKIVIALALVLAWCAPTLAQQMLGVSSFGDCRVLGFPYPLANGMEPSLIIGAQNGCAPGQVVSASSLNAPNISAMVGDYIAVADSDNSRVLFFEPTSGSSAIAVYGQRTFTSRIASDGPRNLNHAAAVAYEPSSGLLAIVDSSNGRILLYRVGNPPALKTYQKAGMVLGMKRLNQGGGTPNGWPACWGNTPNSYYALSAHDIASPEYFCNPAAVKFDTAGNLWVADEGNSRVLRFPAPFHTFEPADLVLGQSDFTSDAPGLGPNHMAGPNDLAFDSVGNLWVADWQNGRALRFDAPIGNGASATIELGQPDFFSRTSTSAPGDVPECGTEASAARACDVAGVVVDSSGSVLLSDFDWNRVLGFIPPLGNGMKASLVLGHSDFTTIWQADTDRRIQLPVGLFVK